MKVHLCLREADSGVSLGTVNELFIVIFLGNNVSKRVHAVYTPVQRKIGPHHFLFVLIYMVQDVRSQDEEKKSITRRKREQDLALLEKPSSVSSRKINKLVQQKN